MTKQELINSNFKHIGTNNDGTELWARNIYSDNNIETTFYFPKVDTTNGTRIVSYNNLIEPYALLQAAFKKEITPNTTWTKKK